MEHMAWEARNVIKRLGPRPEARIYISWVDVGQELLILFAHVKFGWQGTAAMKLATGVDSVTDFSIAGGPLD